MNHDRYDDDYLAAILGEVRSFAIVGASADISRPSNYVMEYLLRRGYACVPVNPGLAGQQLHGQTVFAGLADIGRPVDVIDVFRNSEAALAVTRAALAAKERLQPKVIWMQVGVRNDVAAREAEAAGLRVVMNRCPKIEIARLSDRIGRAGANAAR